MPIFLIQIAVLVILVMSAYKAFNLAQRKVWPDFFYHLAIAIVALSFLLPDLHR